MSGTVSSGAPTPASYSGYTLPSLTNFALNFNAGIASPVAGFTPAGSASISSGVTLPSNNGSFGGGVAWGPGVTTGLLAHAQNNLYSIAGNGLATVAIGGAASQSLIANLFSNWGTNLDSIAQQNANILQTAVNQSNNAKISGILGGAGGFLGGVGSLVKAFAGF